MSELQIALAILGAVVVAAVYAFNAWQERGLKRRLEQVFDRKPDDVLFGGAPDPLPLTRVEPSLGGEPAGLPPRPEAAVVEPPCEGANALIDCVATIDCPQPPEESALRGLHQSIAVFGKPARLFGEDTAAGGWRSIGRDAKAGPRRLQAALQLANRAGPLHAPQLNGFFDALRSWCAAQDAVLELPDTSEILKAAQALDAFCGETDVTIGLNIIAQPGCRFSGILVSQAAEAEGLSLDSGRVFLRRDAAGETLFSLENHEPRGFAAVASESWQTSGLTLLLDLPRVADAEAVMDEMAACGSRMAEALGGQLVDDNRVPLQAAALARIKAQVRGIQAVMAARGIPAGSALARRLFA